MKHPNLPSTTVVNAVPRDTPLCETLEVGHFDLMHPMAHARPFTAAGWMFEMKLDGFRALARRWNGAVELLSRNGRQMNNQFPEVIAALERIPGTWAIDAELVVPDERGHPSFEHVRRRALMRQPHSIAVAAGRHPAALCVFDVLAPTDRTFVACV